MKKFVQLYHQLLTSEASDTFVRVLKVFSLVVLCVCVVIVVIFSFFFVMDVFVSCQMLLLYQ